MPLKDIGRYTHESRTLPLVNCISETFYRAVFLNLCETPAR